MKRFLFILITVFCFGFSTNAQITLNEVTLPAELTVNNQTLVLNGGGIRTKYFFKLYTAGLYLNDKNSDSQAIIKADEITAIHIEITSSMINSDNMAEAINEGFDKSTGGKTDAIRSRIDEILKIFSSQEISIGDVFEIAYIPGIGTQTSKNGTLESTIVGLDFKQALFGIWLSNNPVQADLKEGLLGQ